MVVSGSKRLAAGRVRRPGRRSSPSWPRARRRARASAGARSALGAVPLFLLGVVVAAALGGVWSGLGCSILGFLSLNYFFTAPRHTFRVAHEEDFVALVVFLDRCRGRRVALRADVGGACAGRRSRAGGPPSRLPGDEGALGRAALPRPRRLRGALLEPLRLVRCEIARVGDAAFDAIRERTGGVEGGATTIPLLRAGTSELGTVTAVRPAGSGLWRGRPPTARGRATADRRDARTCPARRAGRPRPYRVRARPGSRCPVLVRDA